MLLAAETIGLCLVFWLICWMGTGTDEKNLRSFRSYPPKVQEMLRADPTFQEKIPQDKPGTVFVSNVLTFSVILFLLGLPLRQGTFWRNFLNILIMGEVLNAFDYLVMDLLWFRKTKRTRFVGTKDRADLYEDPVNHRGAFYRGIPAFFSAAVVDGLLLSLF